ncbi:MAG: hypothetical protein V3T94_02870 [Thermoplasmata archaeon]
MSLSVKEVFLASRAVCGGDSDGLRGSSVSIRRFKEELPAHPFRMNVLAINGSPSSAGGTAATRSGRT